MFMYASSYTSIFAELQWLDNRINKKSEYIPIISQKILGNKNTKKKIIKSKKSFALSNGQQQKKKKVVKVSRYML